MKAIVEKKNKPDFEPVTITLTIESEEELLSLWHRANCNGDHGAITEYIKHISLPIGNLAPVTPFWKILDDIKMERRL